jgi:hypothetical protein
MFMCTRMIRYCPLKHQVYKTTTSASSSAKLVQKHTPQASAANSLTFAPASAHQALQAAGATVTSHHSNTPLLEHPCWLLSKLMVGIKDTVTWLLSKPYQGGKGTSTSAWRYVSSSTCV